MTHFEWFGYTVEVDEPATRDYYAQAEDWGCECGHCRNFVALARERKLPEGLLAILDSASIPPEKATYVCELYHEENWREKGLLYELSWRVAGTILDKPAGKDIGQDWGPVVELPWSNVMLGHNDYPYGAPDFPQPHFDLEFTMYLPWVLDEHVDSPEKKKEDAP